MAETLAMTSNRNAALGARCRRFESCLPDHSSRLYADDDREQDGNGRKRDSETGSSNHGIVPEKPLSLREQIMARRAEAAAARGKPRSHIRTDAEWAAEQALKPPPAALTWQSDRPAQAVYFIQAADGSIKIGVSADPVLRLATLQAAHAYPLTILTVCPGGVEQERAYHQRFADWRLLGEWFSPAPEILAEIQRLNHSEAA